MVRLISKILERKLWQWTIGKIWETIWEALGRQLSWSDFLRQKEEMNEAALCQKFKGINKHFTTILTVSPQSTHYLKHLTFHLFHKWMETIPATFLLRWTIRIHIGLSPLVGLSMDCHRISVSDKTLSKITKCNRVLLSSELLYPNMPIIYLHKPINSALG